ncbi:ferritin-like domain-containing protein [Microcoleus sp. FACHB-1515]|uniref:ferritin-like domain-containing protein n=1 Tax=Cyanophyceae TaxID=3028117 RepID=UPI00168554D3|nr:ferritin-like domain-containing protein [Microcoleus sp. FACHB-1515]MBD2088568.1 ferritin-like domain-containing protein [Microcoleus sp. FACHB-1515]
MTTSRRKLLKWGLCGLGAAALTTVPTALLAQSPERARALTFNADDVGILNFALLLEELESAFYAAAARSSAIRNPREREYLQVLGNHEATHVTFLRNVLGNNVTFRTQDLRFNRAGLARLLRSRDSILAAAVALEDTGVHAYNGAGPSLTNPTYILAAGSIVSVEARHAAGVRALLRRSVTETMNDQAISSANLNPDLNPFRGRAYDELYTPKQIIQIVGSLNLINNPINGALVA